MGTPVQAGEPELVALAKIAKHLETIFARPGVSSRTAAVTRAFPGQAAV